MMSLQQNEIEGGENCRSIVSLAHFLLIASHPPLSRSQHYGAIQHELKPLQLGTRISPPFKVLVSRNLGTRNSTLG